MRRTEQFGLYPNRQYDRKGGLFGIFISVVVVPAVPTAWRYVMPCTPSLVPDIYSFAPPPPFLMPDGTSGASVLLTVAMSTPLVRKEASAPCGDPTPTLSPELFHPTIDAPPSPSLASSAYAATSPRTQLQWHDTLLLMMLLRPLPPLQRSTSSL